MFRQGIEALCGGQGRDRQQLPLFIGQFTAVIDIAVDKIIHNSGKTGIGFCQAVASAAKKLGLFFLCCGDTVFRSGANAHFTDRKGHAPQQQGCHQKHGNKVFHGLASFCLCIYSSP